MVPLAGGLEMPEVIVGLHAHRVLAQSVDVVEGQASGTRAPQLRIELPSDARAVWGGGDPRRKRHSRAALLVALAEIPLVDPST